MYKERKDTAIYDQYTDRSGAVLVKIASRMQNEKLAELALNTLFDMKDRLEKQAATFPSDSRKDVFLSRIYFEGQREKIAQDEAAEIDERLSKYEVLHNVPVRVLFKQAEAIEDDSEELLPNCKVASLEELRQAGADFCREYENLTTGDRITFSENFVKIAEFLDENVPDEVRLYAEEGVVGRPDVPEQVLFRKSAMERMGRDSSSYSMLYNKLNALGADTIANLPNRELHKLACAIDDADTFYGLRETSAGKTIPDAWHSVFMVKHAEDEKAPTNVESMSKADIIGKYGEGVLEEVEDDEGAINYDKLKKILDVVEDKGTVND